MGLTDITLQSDNYIYVVTNDHGLRLYNVPIKVGVTKQPQGRFRDANTWCPDGLLIFALVPVMTRQTEFDLHRLLTDYKVRDRHEWFDLKGEYFSQAALFLNMARAEYQGSVAPYSTELLIVKRLIIEFHEEHKREVYRRIFGDLPRSAINLSDEFIERSLNTAEEKFFPEAKQFSDRLVERHSLILKRQNESDWRNPVVYFEAPVIKSLTGGLGYGSA